MQQGSVKDLSTQVTLLSGTAFAQPEPDTPEQVSSTHRIVTAQTLEAFETASNKVAAAYFSPVNRILRTQQFGEKAFSCHAYTDPVTALVAIDLDTASADEERAIVDAVATNDDAPGLAKTIAAVLSS